MMLTYIHISIPTAVVRFSMRPMGRSVGGNRCKNKAAFSLLRDDLQSPSRDFMHLKPATAKLITISRGLVIQPVGKEEREEE